jgi:DNA-binding MarR family transcriptional regulator
MANFSELGHSWRAITVGYYRQTQDLLDSLDITNTDRLVLMAMRELNKPTKSELAQAVYLKPQSLTRSIDRLVAKGLLARHENKQDLRFVRLSTTAKSRAMVRKLDSKNQAIWKQITKGLSDTKVKSLSSIMGNMLENITEEA